MIEQAFDGRGPYVAGALVLVGNGDSSYGAPTNAVDSDIDGISLSPQQQKVERRTVQGARSERLQGDLSSSRGLPSAAGRALCSLLATGFPIVVSQHYDHTLG